MPLSDIKLGHRLFRMLSPQRLMLEDWRGGLDLQMRVEDAPGNRFLQAKNVDLRAGRLRARPGYRIVASTPAFNFTYLYYSKVFDYLYLFEEKVGGKVYRTKDMDLSGTFTDVTGTITPGTAGVWAVDFNGALVVITSTGVWASTNGTTWTLQNATVVGNQIVAWQNKLWACYAYQGSYGSGPNFQRIWRSNIASYATWTTATDYVDIREGPQGDAPLSALHVTQSDDTTGRPSLLAAKQRALHRINDPTTGASTTLNENVGVLTRNSIASGRGMTAFISERGIFATTGDTRAEEIGAAVRPLFSTKVAAGVNNIYAPAVSFGSRFLFSIPGWDPVASTYQTSVAVVHLEYDTETQTWCTHTFPAHGANDVMTYIELPPTALSSATENDRARLYSTDSTQPTKIFRMFDDVNGGATNDAGTANTMVVQTPYIRPAGGTRVRLHRVRLSVVNGGGSTITLRVRRDGSTTDSIVRTATTGTAGALQDIDFWRLGDCRSVSFIIEQTLSGGVFPSAYRPDTHQEQRFEVVSMMLEYLQTGEN